MAEERESLVRGNYVLITGSSSGLGRSFAEYLADKGYDILLVAYPDHILEETQGYLSSTYNVDVQSFGVDLSVENSVFKVIEWVKQNEFKISILINNVGMGYVSEFKKMPIEFYEKLVTLNAVTMMRMTYHLIPILETHSNAHILNIGSIASLFPAPYKAIYSATKHFIRSLSYSLREELKGSINVTTAFPAGILSNEEYRKRAEGFGWLAKMGMMDPEDVARICIKAMFKKRKSVLPGTAVVYVPLKRILGYKLTMYILKRNFRKQINNDSLNKI